MFFCYCKDHSHLIGFHAMKNHESPRTIHEVSLNRFRRAPARHVYDNACNASRFCLSRHPRYWLYAGFTIDRFHSKNHKKCSPAYDPSVMAEAIGRNTNTQVCEQHNSIIAMTKEQFFQFSQVMYLFHLRYSVYVMICKKIAETLKGAVTGCRNSNSRAVAVHVQPLAAADDETESLTETETESELSEFEAKVCENEKEDARAVGDDDDKNNSSDAEDADVYAGDGEGIEADEEDTEEGEIDEGGMEGETAE